MCLLILCISKQIIRKFWVNFWIKRQNPQHTIFSQFLYTHSFTKNAQFFSSYYNGINVICIHLLNIMSSDKFEMQIFHSSQSHLKLTWNGEQTHFLQMMPLFFLRFFGHLLFTVCVSPVVDREDSLRNFIVNSMPG